MHRIGIILGAPDISVPLLTEDEIVIIVSRWSQASVIPILGRINTALHLELGNQQFQIELAQVFLRTGARERLILRLRKQPNLLWITPELVRILLKLVLTYGQTQGGQEFDQKETKFQIGCVLLSVQPVLRKAPELGPRPKDPEGWLHDLLILNHEGRILSDRPSLTLSIKEFLYNEAFAGSELAQFFESQYGVKPNEVFSGLSALYGYFKLQNAQLLRHSRDHTIDYRMLFSRVGVCKKAGDLLVSELTHDLRPSSPVDSSARVKSAHSDLKIIISKPLALLENNLICCLDIEFLRSANARLLRALIIRISKTTKHKGYIEKLGGFALEKYTRKLFEAIESERAGRTSVKISFETPTREIDCLIVEGKEVIVFETKSSFLPPNLLFGSSTAALAQDIDGKFLECDDRGDPKGFSQLVLSAREILDDPGIVHLKRIKKLYAVLLVEDEMISCKPAILYALHRAQEKLKGLGYVVHQPLILHVEDLELLAERSQKYSVSYMLRKILNGGFTGIRVTDLILSSLPISDSERTVIDRPYPLTDGFLSRLVLPAPSELACPRCGARMTTYTNVDGIDVCKCFGCDTGPSAVPDDVITHLEENVGKLIEDYESS